MWAIVGLLLALLGTWLGWVRSRSTGAGYYEGQVYDMTATSHRRFSIASLAFAGLFALIFGIPVVPALPLLVAYVIFFILYAASFARGATGEDE